MKGKKPWDVELKLATSSNDITHIIVKGYYKCNRAIGKIKRNKIFKLSDGVSINPCGNCFKEVH